MSYYRVSWSVEIGDEFKPEFFALDEDVRTEILALARLLQHFGPQLGRPRVDTLNGSRHANMKKLRFSAAPRAPGKRLQNTWSFDPQPSLSQHLRRTPLGKAIEPKKREAAAA